MLARDSCMRAMSAARAHAMCVKRAQQVMLAIRKIMMIIGKLAIRNGLSYELNGKIGKAHGKHGDG